MELPDGAAQAGLEPRHAQVLKAIIREHVLTGGPVGSSRVARTARLELSPASIRTIMAELEERGLLVQPHKSAGRVPTDKAYRVYVDQLLTRPRMVSAQAEAIDRALERSRGEIPELLEEASRQLSLFSQHVGIVLAPELRRLTVDHIEFVRLDPRRVVAILVGQSGVVHNRILEVAEPLDQPELDRIGRYLSDEFGGGTLPEMRERLRRRMQEERTLYDEVMARNLELGARAAETGDLDGELFVEGASNLLGAPEFEDVGLARTLLRTLEDKRTLVDMLSRLLEGRGVQVVIGEEDPLSDKTRCSVVASSYRAGGRVIGTVGIVGPTRMAYARSIALVDHLAQVLSRLLGEPGH